MPQPLILSNRLQKMLDAAKTLGDTIYGITDDQRKKKIEDDRLARDKVVQGQQDEQVARNKVLQNREDAQYGRNEADRIAADEEQRQILGQSPTPLPTFGTAQPTPSGVQTGVSLAPMDQGGGLAQPELSSMNPAPDVGTQVEGAQGDQQANDMLKAHLMASYRTHKTGSVVTPEEVMQEQQKAKLDIASGQATLAHSTGDEQRAQELQPFKIATEKADATYKRAEAGAQGGGITAVPTVDGVKIFDKRGREITNAGEPVPKPGSSPTRTQASLINDNKSQRELYDKKAAAFVTANGIKEAKAPDGTPVWGSGTGDQNLIDQLIIMETGKSPTKAQYENTTTKYGLGDYIDKVTGKLTSDAKVSPKVRDLIFADIMSQAKNNSDAYEVALQNIANTAKANKFDSAQVVIPSSYRQMVKTMLSSNTTGASGGSWDDIINQAKGGK